MNFFSKNPNLKKEKLGGGGRGVAVCVGGGEARVSEFLFRIQI